MRCSTIIVTYNHRQHIERCLRALLPTLGPDDDVIVVDNASIDGTSEFIADAYPSVRLLCNGTNAGFGAACNSGAAASDAELLIFLNPDTEPLHDWLQPLLDGLEMPGVGLVTPKLLLRDQPDRIDAIGHDIHISGIATCRGWGQPAHRFMERQEVAAVSGACFAIKRTLFNDLRGFDERLFLYYEDDDLSLRARLSGYRCVAEPKSEVLHDHRPGFTPQKMRYLERNRLWTMLKLLDARTLASLAPALLAGELLAWGMALRSGPAHTVAKLLSYIDVTMWTPTLRHARSTVRRRARGRELLQLHRAAVSLEQVDAGRLATTATPAVNVCFSGLRAFASRLAS